jgi:hypothetical protein
MSAQTSPRPGRNEPCFCGSGRKYKQCCLAKDEAAAAKARAKAAKEAAKEAKEAKEAAEAPAAAEGSAAPAAAPKHRTHQPWKATNARGFVPRSTAPRKMGGG